MIIVTDSGMRARAQFPDAKILTTAAAVLALPQGTEITIVNYCPPGMRGHDPVASAAALIASGVLTAAPDRPGK